jgi:hypothetical protein
MKNSIFFKLLFVFALLFILILPVPGFSWQGRMAGTGDAYGLLEDESDFLIHPAAVTPGKDLYMYGIYRLTYDYVPKWDNEMILPPPQDDKYPYEAKGHEWKNEGQAGIAFPLGDGRMGLFFEYTGNRADYDCDEYYYITTTAYNKFKMESKSDKFNLRAIYSKPFGTVKLGCEIQFSHTNEENTNIIDNRPGDYTHNYFNIAGGPALDQYKYMIPFRSDYYESLGKLSIEGKSGTVKNTFTIKGGAALPFASNNTYDYHSSGANEEASMKGEVNGWNAGFDYWVRFPLNKDISLPFVVSVLRKQTKRDGSGNSNTAHNLSYEHKTEYFNATIGGGADDILSRGTRIAAGLYYDYLQSSQDVNITEISVAQTNIYNYPEYPSKKEHRITLKTMTEINLSSNFTFLSGLNAYYGMVKNNFSSKRERNPGSPTETKSSMDGYNWGLNLSFGTVYKADKINIEPFINAGFCKYKVSGDGYFDGSVQSDTTVKSEKTDWIISGGLSVKY